MKKIIFGITGLTLGGAERVLVDIANNLCDRYDITIFTIYAKGELEKQLDSRVKLKSLYSVSYLELPTIKRKILAPLKILFFKNYIYKKYIKNDYDVEISFLEGPITRLFSVKNKSTRKITWIHNDISKVFGKGFKSKLKRYIDKKVYCKYADLIFVSKENLNNFNEIYNTKKLKEIPKKVIYNYIDAKRVIEKSNEEENIDFNEDKINFVSVARLVEQKAIDRLIKVHKRLIEKYGDNHNFWIIGDGPERERLENLVKKYDVEKSFFLMGKKENPYPYIRKADYFCLLSKFEGYGMVLEEAKILNKPIIITDTAAREAVDGYNNKCILENTEDGIFIGLAEILENKKIENTENSVSYDNKKNLDEIIKLIGE